MDTTIKAAACMIFAAMAGVCLIGGVAVLTKKKDERP